MIAHARDPVTPPATRRPGLSSDLEAVVLRCLAKRPADRFDTADELDRAFATCADATTWSADCARRWWHEAEHAPVEPDLASA